MQRARFERHPGLPAQKLQHFCHSRRAHTFGAGESYAHVCIHLTPQSHEIAATSRSSMRTYSVPATRSCLNTASPPPPSPHRPEYRCWTGQHCRDNGTTIMLGIMGSICLIPSSFDSIISTRPPATNLSATMASAKSFIALFALVAVLHGAAAEVRVDIRETGWSQGGLECCERPIQPTIFFVFPFSLLHRSSSSPCSTKRIWTCLATCFT